VWALRGVNSVAALRKARSELLPCETVALAWDQSCRGNRYLRLEVQAFVVKEKDARSREVKDARVMSLRWKFNFRS
jgi:hypothetical protein